MQKKLLVYEGHYRERERRIIGLDRVIDCYYKKLPFRCGTAMDAETDWKGNPNVHYYPCIFLQLDDCEGWVLPFDNEKKRARFFAEIIDTVNSPSKHTVYYVTRGKFKWQDVETNEEQVIPKPKEILREPPERKGKPMTVTENPPADKNEPEKSSGDGQTVVVEEKSRDGVVERKITASQPEAQKQAAAKYQNKDNPIRVR